jgi:N-acyl-D-amino-acid deacylase
VGYDLVVRNGVVIDGTGTPGRQVDVAVLDGKLAAIGRIEDSASEEIDAEGHIVSPGFVDGHTHMDAQVFWDELGTSSCWHGVTTVVMGNCGFTLAPARPEERPLVVRNLEQAEDISAAAMAEGINWTWSTFSEYLDAVEALPKGINYVCSVGHSALRTWAMGERAFVEPATPEDLEVMEAELIGAVEAGAMGFTTSRSQAHTTPGGGPVASRVARWEEVVALVELLGRHGGKLFQLAPEFLVPEGHGPDPEERERLKRGVRDLAVSSRVPIAFGVNASRTLGFLDLMEDAAAQGGRIYGFTSSRLASVLWSFQTRLPFDALPSWSELRAEPLEQQRYLLQRDDVRARLVSEAKHDHPVPLNDGATFRPDIESLRVMLSVHGDNPTVGQLAAQRRLDPVEVMIELALANAFELFFVQQFPDHTEESDAVALMKNENTAMTFSDSGAHVVQIADASIQTHLLAHWVRDRQALTLEEAISMVTSRPARMWGIEDRGILREGLAADITIFDPKTVAARIPRLVNDLPGGSRRLIQRAIGYKATIVNGEVLMRDGEATEVRSGRLLRNSGLRNR